MYYLNIEILEYSIKNIKAFIHLEKHSYINLNVRNWRHCDTLQSRKAI